MRYDFVEIAEELTFPVWHIVRLGNGNTSAWKLLSSKLQKESAIEPSDVRPVQQLSADGR